MTVHYERIPSTDPRLNRHVRHDELSRLYAFDTSGLALRSVRHARRIPILDQGQLGSCTGNAGVGCLGTDPYYSTVAGGDGAHRAFSRRAGVGTRYSLDEAGAVQLYSDATAVDDFPGRYPPEDTGSDGLTIAKVLTKAGEISGYRHTFTLNDALLALTVTPFITGISWYNSMFTPDATGRVQPDGRTGLAGGHEIVADELNVEREEVWFANSWGASWGIDGRFWMTFEDYGHLLDQQGDVTIFTPLTAPPPDPADPDAVLARVAHLWVRQHHTSIAGNRRMQAALKAWLKVKNL